MRRNHVLTQTLLPEFQPESLAMHGIIYLVGLVVVVLFLLSALGLR